MRKTILAVENLLTELLGLNNIIIGHLEDEMCTTIQIKFGDFLNKAASIFAASNSACDVIKTDVVDNK